MRCCRWNAMWASCGAARTERRRLPESFGVAFLHGWQDDAEPLAEQRTQVRVQHHVVDRLQPARYPAATSVHRQQQLVLNLQARLIQLDQVMTGMGIV